MPPRPALAVGEILCQLVRVHGGITQVVAHNRRIAAVNLLEPADVRRVEVATDRKPPDGIPPRPALGSRPRVPKRLALWRKHKLDEPQRQLAVRRAAHQAHRVGAHARAALRRDIFKVGDAVRRASVFGLEAAEKVDGYPGGDRAHPHVDRHLSGRIGEVAGVCADKAHQVHAVHPRRLDRPLVVGEGATLGRNRGVGGDGRLVRVDVGLGVAGGTDGIRHHLLHDHLERLGHAPALRGVGNAHLAEEGGLSKVIPSRGRRVGADVLQAVGVRANAESAKHGAVEVVRAPHVARKRLGNQDIPLGVRHKARRQGAVGPRGDRQPLLGGLAVVVCAAAEENVDAAGGDGGGVVRAEIQPHLAAKAGGIGAVVLGHLAREHGRSGVGREREIVALAPALHRADIFGNEVAHNLGSAADHAPVDADRRAELAGMP